MSNTPSDAELEKLARQHLKAFVQFSLGEVWFEGEVEFARAVLAWGTPQPSPVEPPAPRGEPVAWLNPWRVDQVTTDYDAYGRRGIPLYTAPQPVARERLTPERVKEIVRGAGYDQCGIPETERAAFINGLRHGEREHGIKGGQHVS